MYKVIGISKQAVFKYNKKELLYEKKIMLLMTEVELIREEHPGCGLEKMYYMLQPAFIGRDTFIELFMNLGFRVRKFKNYKRTTFSSETYYSNLINGLQIADFGDVWQTDITYIEVGNKFSYAVYIIDVYTRVIVGYSIAQSLHAESNIKALQMATKKYGYPKIHHSDRGTQYTSTKYTELLKQNKCKISMGKCAQENAYAERINLTIKDEYLKYRNIQNHEQLIIENKKAVTNYNVKRIHNNLNRKTPIEFMKESLLNKTSNKYQIIYDYENHPFNIKTIIKNSKPKCTA
jgi:putative transposase